MVSSTICTTKKEGIKAARRRRKRRNEHHIVVQYYKAFKEEFLRLLTIGHAKNENKIKQIYSEEKQKVIDYIERQQKDHNIYRDIFLKIKIKTFWYASKICGDFHQNLLLPKNIIVMGAS